MRTFSKMLSEAMTADLEDEIFAAITDDGVSQNDFNSLLHQWIKGSNPVLAGTPGFERNDAAAYNTTYLSGQLTPALAKMSANRIEEHGFSGVGILVQPLTYQYLRSETLKSFDGIAIDNGMFTKAGRENFTWPKYEKMIKVALAQEKRDVLRRIHFFTVPDVPFDWEATKKKFDSHSEDVSRLRKYGAPVAICIQNGANVDNVPFDKVDVIFIGGDDEYKVGKDAQAITKKAHNMGKQVHMGRVNNTKRLNTASEWKTGTADGTYIMHELAKALHEIERTHPRRRGESVPQYAERLRRLLHAEHGPEDLHPGTTGKHVTEPEIVSNFVNYVVDSQYNNHVNRRYAAIADMVKSLRGRPLNKTALWQYDRFLPQVPGMEQDEDVVTYDKAGNVVVDAQNRPLKNREIFDNLHIRQPYRHTPPGIPKDPKEYTAYMNRYIARMRDMGVMPR